VHELQVRRHRSLVGLRIEPVARAVHDDVVADDRVGRGLDAGIAAVPHHVAFDDIDGLPLRAVHEHARIARVVDDIVAHDIRVRTELHLDAVALGRIARVMDPVVLDQRVRHDAGRIVAADVHALAGAAVLARMVDVVVLHRDAGHRGAEIDPDIDIVDLQMIERDVGVRAAQVDAVAAVARDLEPGDAQPGRALDVDRVLDRRGRGPCDQRQGLTVGALDQDWRGSRAAHTDADATRIGIGTGVHDERIARSQRFDRCLETLAGKEFHVGCRCAGRA